MGKAYRALQGSTPSLQADPQQSLLSFPLERLLGAGLASSSHPSTLNSFQRCPSTSRIELGARLQPGVHHLGQLHTCTGSSDTESFSGSTGTSVGGVFLNDLDRTRTSEGRHLLGLQKAPSNSCPPPSCSRTPAPQGNPNTTGMAVSGCWSPHPAPISPGYSLFQVDLIVLGHYRGRGGPGCFVGGSFDPLLLPCHCLVLVSLVLGEKEMKT